MTQQHQLERYEGVPDKIGEVIITPEEIEQRVGELGRLISDDYRDQVKQAAADKQSLLLVGLMKGVVIFMADLMRAITIPVEVDFMQAASRTTAEADRRNIEVHFRPSLPVEVQGRHVIFVEDIIDKGLMLNHTLRTLRRYQPASLSVCTMFEKQRFRVIETPIKYKGFDLPDKFVVGYGLDYRERYRNLPFVATLPPESRRD